MWRVLFAGDQQIRKQAILLHGLWLLIILASTWINHTYSRREIEQIAITEARTIFQRNMVLRRWVSSQGGVYIPVSRRIPPNPYLSQIPDRDITKPDGTPLTLINPAYLLRLIAESGNGEDNTAIIHMTSLNPLRPENGPDDWERAALRRSESGNGEVSEFTTIDGQPYLRYLHAVRAEAPCLKCHAAQGYHLGDQRGGLSVALPVGNLLAEHDNNIRILFLWHLVIYLLGAATLLWGKSFVSKRIKERDQAARELEERAADFRTVADFAYAWEYWLAPDGRMKYVSPSAKRITGYTAQQFLENPELLKNIIAGDDRELLHRHLQPERRDNEITMDFRIRAAFGEVRWLRHICRPVYDRQGVFLGQRASNYDITWEKAAGLQREELVGKLREALDKVKTLSGFLPICASCKKIRDDHGYWNQIEAYISEHSEAVFSHGLCPECARKLYQDFCSSGPNNQNNPANGGAPGSTPEK